MRYSSCGDAGSVRAGSVAVDIAGQGGRIRFGAGLGEGDGVRGVGTGLLPHLLERGRLDDAVGGGAGLEQLDRVALLPGVDLLLGPVGDAQSLDALVVVVAV